MIDSIRLQDFKGHKDTTVPLGRLTMLVGDNASGKTSVLEALSLLSALGPLPHMALQGDRAPIDLIRRTTKGGFTISAEGARSSTGASGDWRVEVTVEMSDQTSNEWRAKLVLADSGRYASPQHRFICGPTGSSSPIEVSPPWDQLPPLITPAPLYRLEAKAIAAGTFGAGQFDQSTVESGANTAAVLANMKLSRDEEFLLIEAALRKLVPSGRRVRLQPVFGSSGGHKIYFDFENAASIPAHGASHGTLIALSLLTILYGPYRPNLLLLDDFDHALHPRAQIELVKMLKALLGLEEFANLQIVATTHSPYVLDELAPEDVRVFALRPDGTVATKRLSEHPDAAKSKGMISAGQLWSMDPEKDWVVGG